jgi:hypothetical protein
MNKFKQSKNGIALLALVLLVVSTAVSGWAKSLGAVTELNRELQQRTELPFAKVVPIPANRIAIEDKDVDSEAHISEVTLGHDKKMSEPTDEFGTDDTIFAAVEIADSKQTVKVKGRLHVVEIAGQKPGPIPGIEAIVTIKGDGTANFQFSKPTRGWPLGKYKFEALLVDESGETIDSESHEFTVE